MHKHAYEQDDYRYEFHREILKGGLCFRDENGALDYSNGFARHHDHTVPITSCEDTVKVCPP
jgi:hypothetical protein